MNQSVALETALLLMSHFECRRPYSRTNTGDFFRPYLEFSSSIDGQAKGPLLGFPNQRFDGNFS